LKKVPQKTKIRAKMKMFVVFFTTLVAGSQGANIVEVLQANGATQLVDLAVKAGLGETLTGDGPFTVFAPTNEAFGELPAELVQSLVADTEMLKKVLLYHVVSGVISSDMADNDIKLDSVQGSPLLVNLYLKSKFYDGFITVNGKRVVKADKKASNGMVHFIDGVILPPKGDLVTTLASDERFSTLVTAVKAAGLVSTVQEADAFTIFAPTNDAFAKVPEAALSSLLADKEALTAVLLRHVVPGSLFAKGIMWAEQSTAGGEVVATQVFRRGVVKVVAVGGDGSRAVARVIDTDIAATNGVVHAIDTVI